MRWQLLLAGALASACAGEAAPDAPAGNTGDGAELRARMPPANTIPCNHPEYWRHSLASASLPLRVHYMQPGDKATAQRVLDGLERAWRIEVGELGWRRPPSDDGRCGPDGAFDAFLWRGHEECYVDVIGSQPGVPWDARESYLVVDPWGKYGGDLLPSTLAHEFNHACQAADDWSDLAVGYEMSANFMQKIVVPSDENYRESFADFQARPDWSLDRDDGYRTWYAYGASLYLFYLRDRFFDGDPRFLADVWLGLRGDRTFEDALDALLPSGFMASVVELARWRWYTGPRDDGKHFADGAEFGAPSLVTSATVPARPGRVALDPAPMVLGSSYVRLTGGAGDLTVALASTAPVRWVVQAVPGLDGSDGEVLDVGAGAARLRFAADGTRTLIVTALPLDASAYRPARKHDTRYAATLVLR